jgi:hypothetical protein
MEKTPRNMEKTPRNMERTPRNMEGSHGYPPEVDWLQVACEFHNFENSALES